MGKMTMTLEEFVEKEKARLDKFAKYWRDEMYRDEMYPYNMSEMEWNDHLVDMVCQEE